MGFTEDELLPFASACRGVLLVRIKVGKGLTALAVGAGGVGLDIFLSSIISYFFLPLFGLVGWLFWV